MARITSLLLLAATATAQVTTLLKGQGEIHVLNSSSLTDASPADKIGCLDEGGMLTMGDCAVFTRLDSYPNTMSSTAGNCTFSNQNMPVNSDSVYGNNSHAWSCMSDHVGVISDQLYTVNGFKYPFLCNMDVDCFYDIKTGPSDADDYIPVWQYFWGSQQMGITPGHVQAMWLWVPVNSSSTSS
ncbi:hypothetical protein QBC46DRAFT_424092 [Diplogelasinospora grovesii]|uniref:Uncharacterized protein n=1 Tax=Diplogelasinospora grovesii TaxID=303347 RepID=A0AAN6MZI2_9PEZI|nr:hypothetical protein QBC46DRAFT_424092 [Diplogelasinospora grovesii]